MRYYDPKSVTKLFDGAKLDVLIAVFVLLASFIWSDTFFLDLRGLAILYMLMCVAFYKYEAILQRNK